MAPEKIAFVCVAVAACGGAPAPVESAHVHEHTHEHEMHDMPHRFERAEEWVARFEGPARDAWQKPDEVVRVLAIAPGMTVADLGTGTGYFLSRLSRAVGPNGAVLALDVEPDMIRYVRERAAREGLAVVRAEAVPADDPRLPAGKVDRVLVVDTWHHIADRDAYAKKLAAGLAPGGAVFVVDFTMETKQGPPVHHRIRAEEVMATLSAAGLRAEIVPEDLPEQYVVAGRR